MSDLIPFKGKVIRKKEVLELLGGINPATLYNLVNKSLMPPQFTLGERAVGWYEHEILQVVKARSLGAENAEIKALVASLVESRSQLAA
jgi:prophage regulatory protein